MPATTWRAITGIAVVAALALVVAGGAALVTGWDAPAGAATSLSGNGSSFAAPAVLQWQSDVTHSPYNLSINYTSSSSGEGRFEFTNRTVDFAVSDTGYVNSSVGTTPPSFPYEFLPVTAAGVAFMYNIPGLTQTLQLTSYTACLALTGQVKNWDDPVFHQNGANSGVTLPNLAIKPVTESDPAGTNYVLEEYCIEEQPTVWAQYAKNMQGFPPPSGVAISATNPGSNWEAPGNGYDEQSTPAVASNVANTGGSIGAVQEQYAADSGFKATTPARSVAAVQNASGDYTLPTPVDVASALAYATQKNSQGIHVLDFNGLGPNVYNPSTYSYLLTPTTGWNSAKGAVMSGFVNYVLTLGQKEAPSISYASLGLSLERYGIDQVTANVPGAVTPTSAESQGYSCGDLTPTEVQAGQTTPTCGVTNGTPPPPPPGATTTTLANGGSTSGTTGSSGTTGGTGGTAGSTSGSSAQTGSASQTGVTSSGTTGTSGTSGASRGGTGSAGTGNQTVVRSSGTTGRLGTAGASGGGTGSGGTGSLTAAGGTSGSLGGSSGGTTGGAGGASSVDPSVSLSAISPTGMASTGADSLPMIAFGSGLFVLGWAGRRRLLATGSAARTG